jgi:hypothetical protein
MEKLSTFPKKLENITSSSGRCPEPGCDGKLAMLEIKHPYYFFLCENEECGCVFEGKAQT